jgi:hypothetical protein
VYGAGDSAKVGGVLWIMTKLLNRSVSFFDTMDTKLPVMTTKKQFMPGTLKG